jgi:hypothetical protein
VDSKQTDRVVRRLALTFIHSVICSFVHSFIFTHPSYTPRDDEAGVGGNELTAQVEQAMEAAIITQARSECDRWLAVKHASL